MICLEKKKGFKLDEDVTIEAPSKVIYSGDADLYIKYEGVPLTSLNNDEEGDYLLDMAGTYTFYMPKGSCKDAKVLISAVLCECDPSLPSEGSLLSSNIIQVKYLPDDAAPCLDGFLVVKEKPTGEVSVSLTSFSGDVLDMANNPVVSGM